MWTITWDVGTEFAIIIDAFLSSSHIHSTRNYT